MASFEMDDVREGIEDISSEMPPDQGAVLMTLKQLHAKHDELEEQFQSEYRALQQKYTALKAPVLEERRQALTRAPLGDRGTVLENFWLKAMQKHRQVRDVVEQVDEPVLAYLQNISTHWNDPGDEKQGFSLVFEFAANPFFEPLQLVKTYRTEGDTLLCTEATQVQWKPGKDITTKTVKRKQKNKRTKQIRVLSENVTVPSFFSFFAAHEIPTEEEMQTMTEDKVEELEVLVEQDYEVGAILRTQIVPNALLWYTGEAVNSDESDDEEGDEESDDDDDLEEVDDDDEGDGDKAKKPKKGARKNPGEPPNCKQQ